MSVNDSSDATVR